MNSKYEELHRPDIIGKTEQGNESREVKLEGLFWKSRQKLKLILNEMGKAVHNNSVSCSFSLLWYLLHLQREMLSGHVYILYTFV